MVSYLQDGVPDNPDDITAFQAAFEWGENPSQDFKTVLEFRNVKEMQGEAAKRGWPSKSETSGQTYPTWGITPGLGQPDP